MSSMIAALEARLLVAQYTGYHRETIRNTIRLRTVQEHEPSRESNTVNKYTGWHQKHSRTDYYVTLNSTNMSVTRNSLQMNDYTSRVTRKQFTVQDETIRRLRI